MKYTIFLLLLSVPFLSIAQTNSKVNDRTLQIFNELTDTTTLPEPKPGEAKKALEYYKRVLEKAKHRNMLPVAASALLNIAEILKKENAAKSLEDLKQALSIAESIHEPELTAKIFGAMAGVYEQEKNYREAVIVMEEQHHLVDSLLVESHEEEVKELDSSLALGKSREKIYGLELANKKTEIELDAGIVLIVASLIVLLILWFYLKKVRKLNAELKKSNEIKDKLFSIIGHDLKGPVGSMAQMLAMLETDAFPEKEVKNAIAALRKQSEASHETLIALFEWGKAQLRGVNVNPVNFLARTIIEKNLSVLKSQSDKKSITINDHVLPAISIYADPDQFDFVIRNLLSNAIKFNYPAGTIEINAKKEKGNIIFSVKDNGKGIAPEQQAAFLKSNLSVSFGTIGEKGTGLGLLLTKEFIKANKGKIWLESQEGEGTTFYFSLKEGE